MLTLLKFLFGGGPDEASTYSSASGESYIQDAAGETDDLALAAVNRGNRTRFIELLVHQGMWVIVRLDSAQYEGDVNILEYEESERRVLPVFSSLYEAWAFIHTVDISQMVPLQYLHVSSLFLTHNDLSGFKVVMNPFAGAATEIQESDLLALRNMVMESQM